MCRVRFAGHVTKEQCSRRTLCRLMRRLLGCLVVGLVAGGCGAFSPAFVNLLDPEGTGGFATVDNAPGHVVIAFVNNAEVDERLLAFLESTEGGNLVLTGAEKRALRPRIRLRVRVTFTDGTFQTIEFVDGSRNLVDQGFAAQTFFDLNQNDLTNAVVVCDVSSVNLEPGSDIEVFVPVELAGFELVETTSQAGTVIGFEPLLRDTIPPLFRALQVDDVSEDGRVTLQRNIGIRDVPSPAVDPRCGSVIAIVVNGVLSVPFLDGVSDAPSFDRDDAFSVAGIGGRFEFLVAVQ